MTPPRLEVIQTKEGRIFRIHYAGMIKEHRQEWQANWYYQQVLNAYVEDLANR